LFNRGTTTVNFAVTPYSVQYSSATGTFSAGNTMGLTTGSLVPGQYFLIKFAGGTTNGAPLPAADATDTGINMSATDGKVGLVIGTTVLSGGGCPIAATVADFIGYGSANCAETSATAALSATKSARRTNSCIDTNNNAADFTIVSNPTAPRNSLSPLNDCSAADLSITKTGSPNPVNAGENISYTLTVTNNSSLNAAQNVTVTDAVPTNTTFVSVGTLSSGWTRTDSTAVGGTGTVSYTKSSLAASATATFTVTVKVDSSAANNSTISNTASVSSDTVDSDQSNNSQTATTTVRTPADLSLVKTVDNPTPNVSDHVAFTITLNNAGPYTATGVTVSDSLPTGLAFVSANASQGSYDSNAGTWTVGNVSITGPAATMQINATVQTTGAKTNTAQMAQADQFDPDTSNNQSSVTVTAGQPASADLSITKTDSPDPVAVGNDITYTITVTNGGLDTASNAALSDTVPTNTTFRSITPPVGWTCGTTPAVGGTGAIGCTNPSFGVGSADFTLVVRVGAAVADGTSISNTASISSSTFDPDTGDNSATETTTVRNPGVTISQVYGAGGNAGATYQNDFVELFNRTSGAIDISAWSVQYQAAATVGGVSGTAWSVAQICTSTVAGTCMLPANSYYLVKLAGGANGVALPTADSTPSNAINMAASAGKVALVSNTTALVSPNGSGCPSSFASVIDFVGYGSTANCFEGAGPTPAPSTTNAAIRGGVAGTGCTDTNNNASDFAASPVTAHNSASPTHRCP